jgi:tRNA(Ile2) C34 agmatinyltransferase TiaS
LTHKGRHNKCPTCASRLTIGGEYKKCSRCGYTNKPVHMRVDYARPRKLGPEKAFESSLSDKIRRWGGRAIVIRRTRRF